MLYLAVEDMQHTLRCSRLQDLIIQYDVLQLLLISDIDMGAEACIDLTSGERDFTTTAIQEILSASGGGIRD